MHNGFLLKSRYEYLVTNQVQTLYYQESRIKNQESRINTQYSRIKNQESTVHRQGSQALPHSLAIRPQIRDGLSGRTLMASGLKNRSVVKAFLITSSQYTSQSFHQTRARNSKTSMRTNMGPTWISCLNIYFRLIHLIKKKKSSSSKNLVLNPSFE